MTIWWPGWRITAVLTLLALWAVLHIFTEFQLHGLRSDVAALAPEDRDRLAEQLADLDRDSSTAGVSGAQASPSRILTRALTGWVTSVASAALAVVLVLALPLLLTLYEEGRVTADSPVTWRHILLMGLTVGFLALVRRWRARSAPAEEDDL